MEIEIAGRRFRVRSDDDDRYVQTLVDFVNQRLEHMRRAANLVDREQTALLCLVDLADALFRERGARERLRDQVATESTQLRQLLVALSEPPPAREPAARASDAGLVAARASDAALAAAPGARPRARRP